MVSLCRLNRRTAIGFWKGKYASENGKQETQRLKQILIITKRANKAEAFLSDAALFQNKKTIQKSQTTASCRGTETEDGGEGTGGGRSRLIGREGGGFVGYDAIDANDEILDLLETTQQRPRALTSPIFLKTSRRIESGR
ncbi:unnamed protein product [Microthlaspi erraticum]|uniref:Uncharacterized protein n=1 Tax=Microthlaspi erraticum TaxID=1685480 RepID=A0A6D2HXQ2_9BRAS|nr:unnamed protein product [Microthlaspi erraticum]